MMGCDVWGARAPSRAGCGALAATLDRDIIRFGERKRKVRDDEGVIAGTRGRVRSPASIEDSPRWQLRTLLGLESLRDTGGFAKFRPEVARRRAIMKRRVEAMRDQLGLAAE